MRTSSNLRPSLNTRKSVVTGPRQIYKVGRNDACPCGSGKKYKDCHFAEGDAFLKKMARKELMAKKRAHLEKLKADGVPWWKRFLQSL
jgi:hypothetical protein